MASFTINVNSDEVIRYTERLERLHKSAFPVAVRQTLNEQAFQTKKKELIMEFEAAFETRSKSFPKAFSKVEMATGFDVKTMMSKVGFTDRKRGGKSEQAGRDMVQQQLGGNIGGRTFIPIDPARVSKSPQKRVKAKERLSSISKAKVVDSSVNRAKTSKQRYVRTALHAAKRYGPGTYMSHKGENGKTTLYRIDKVGSDLKTRDLFIGVTPVYSVEEGRSVRVSANPVTARAARKVNRNVERIFVKHAKGRFNKTMRK